MDNEKNYNQESAVEEATEYEVVENNKNGILKGFGILGAIIGIGVVAKKISDSIKEKKAQEDQDFVDAIEDSIVSETEAVDDSEESK